MYSPKVFEGLTTDGRPNGFRVEINRDFVRASFAGRTWTARTFPEIWGTSILFWSLPLREKYLKGKSKKRTVKIELKPIPSVSISVRTEKFFRRMDKLCKPEEPEEPEEPEPEGPKEPRKRKPKDPEEKREQLLLANPIVRLAREIEARKNS